MRYWKRIDTEGNTTTVESYSHSFDVDGAIEIDEQEFNEFISSLPEPEPEPPSRDPLKELDALKVQLKLSGVIE